MIVNPSIYNGFGRLNYNYDPFNQRKSAQTSPFPATKAPYTNSLANNINQAMNSAVKNFSTDFKASLTGLNAAAKDLVNAKSAVYSGRTVTENNKAFSVDSALGAKIGANTLSITQLASAQKNFSTAYAKDASELSGKGFDLTIKKGSQSKTLKLNGVDGETNGETLTRFAKTINDSKSGVTARVKEDQYGYSNLEITSNETGKESKVELSGTLAEDLKLNDKQEDGKNLEYELNGVQGTSSSNTLTQDNGRIKITAKEVTTEAQSFTVKEDASGLAKGIARFADAYNAFIDNAKANNNPLTQSIANQFESFVSKSINKMDLKGISLDENGKMTIDQKQLTKSVDTKYDDVKNDVMKFDSFAKVAERKTENMLRSPISNYMPDLSNKQNMVKPFIYNYDKSSYLNNLNSSNVQGSIIDIAL